jgi:hypothetical protein
MRSIIALAGLSRCAGRCVSLQAPCSIPSIHVAALVPRAQVRCAATSAPEPSTPPPSKPHRKIQQLGQAAPISKSAAAKGAAARTATAKKAVSEIKHMKIDLPKVHDFKVKSAAYVKSSTKLDECPPEKHPEFAVIGRSNVGKSSLINMITENSKLAKVSKAPGNESVHTDLR